MKTIHDSSGWVRVRRDRRCPICGNPDYCSISADGAVCVCMRVQAGSRKRTRNGGFLHRLDESKARAPFGAHVCTVGSSAPTRHDLTALVQSYKSAVNPARLKRLADSLDLSLASLQRLAVGWAFDHGAWSFPMTDAGGCVVGIRLRLPNGHKLAIAGGREGLFIPADLPDESPLLITEGPTDCAALLDLGFIAVGRPSCTGGVRLLVELARKRQPAEIVIVADDDAPGQRGAATLAIILRAHVPTVRILTPPAGIKDARAWNTAGVTRAEVFRAIAAAPALSLRISNHFNRKR